MRIGLVSYEYPPQQGLGGVGTYIFRLAGALGRAGHEVHVIAGPSNFPPVEQLNVVLHRISAQHLLRSRHRAVHWLYWHGLARLMTWLHPSVWHWIKWDLATYDAIEGLHAERPLDLVEAPEHAANGWMAGRIHRWPIVMRVHCPWGLFVRVNRFPFNPMHRLLAHLERRTMASVPDATMVPSFAMRRELLRHWSVRRPPVVVPNFMDVPPRPAPLPLEDPDGAQRIVCIGRIEPLKGQDVLARAFASIAGKYPQLRLQFVGPDRWPGPMRFAGLLTQLVPDPQVRQRIDLPGAVPLAEVPAILRGARLVVIASRGFESFSFAALEAMACARPVVATSAGALPEIVEDGRTGLIVPPDNAAALASAIERLLGDPKTSRNLGEAGHARAAALYDTPRVLPQIMSTYDDAGDYFYQARAARGPLTAQQWRRALEASREAA